MIRLSRLRLLSRMDRPPPIVPRAPTSRVALSALAGLLTLVCAARLVHAAALLVLPASGENVSAVFVEQAHHHLVNALIQIGRGRFQVLAPDGHATAKPLEPARAIDKAAALGADVAVTLHIAHDPLTTLLVLTGYPIRAATAPVQILKRLTIGPQFLAASIQEMAGDFLAQSQPPFSDPMARHQATYGPPPRETFVGLGAGSATAFNTAGGGITTLPSIAIFVLKMMPSTFADFRGEYASGAGASVGSLGAGFAWLPAGRGVYLGFGAKWSNLTFGGRGANGIAAQPTVGFLHRSGTSPIFRAELGYVMNLFAELEHDRLIPGAGDGHFTHGPITNVGIAF